MLQHNLTSYWRMAMAMARSQMQYRLNFIATLIATVLTYGAQFLSIYWLSLRFQELNGWRLAELVLLYALAILAWGFAVSFFASLQAFEDQIRNGTFDRALLRPMNPLLHVLGSQSPVEGLGQFTFSIAAFTLAFRATGVAFTPVKFTYLILTALGGGMIFGGALIIVAAAAFWTTRTYTFYWGVLMPARQLIQYPVSIYPRALQVVLTVAVPFAFINYFPAHVLLDRTGQLNYPVLAWLTPVVGIATISAAYFIWDFGTRFYTGTGS
jgi:ABC-2 type transport system permease protein